MPVANEKTLRDLEFGRVLRQIADFASSSLGAEAVIQLEPVADPQAIRTAAADVQEAMRFLTEHQRFSLGAVRDVVPLLERAKQPGALAGEDLLTIAMTIEGTERVRSVLRLDEVSPRLDALADRLSDQEDLRKAIAQAIDERGAVRDDATPELRELTTKRRSLETKIEKQLRAVIAQSPELISEPVLTRRQGRLVIPIRSGVAGSNRFVIHDRSATGQTLYGEPTSLIKDNNVIAELGGEIDEAKRRVRGMLTQRFLDREAPLRRDRLVLAYIDSLFARATFAETFRCAFPQTSHRVALRHARHPLLPKETAVPISISLDEKRRIVVITGPNTGGKTVTLKTIGLFVLMLQAGIPLPASPDSELPIVRRVRSDIGDEQSIEQNLSTFSSHVKNIVSILDEAHEDTLVLLDELGAGTDPQEGAALGLAILHRLLERNAQVIVSTHLTPLKYFAIRHPQVRTASMEFDTSTLMPTFRVIEGLPGKSNAFLIASKLAFPQELIEHARTFLSGGEIRAEDIIAELQQERRALADERAEAAAARQDADALRRRYEGELRRFRESKEEALSGRLRDAERFLRESQKEVEQLLAALRRKPSEDEAREAVHSISDLRDQADKLLEPRSEEKHEPLDPQEIAEGTAVFVRSLQASGRILGLGPGDQVLVDLGGARVRTAVADLSTTSKAVPAPAEEKPRRSVRGAVPRRIPLQLDVRGMTVQEALRSVENYLDQLLLADIRAASVLHGKGTGALREAVRAYLSSCEFLSEVRAAAPRNGGDGVTEFATRQPTSD